MKVAILVKDLCTNGGNRVSLNLASILARKGKSVDLIVGKLSKNTAWVRNLAIPTLTLSQVKSNYYDLAISTYFTEVDALNAINAYKKARYIQADYYRYGSSTTRVETIDKYIHDSPGYALVVSSYLKDRLQFMGVNSTILRPSIDHDLFYYDSSFGKRIENRVLVEGSMDSLKKVKESYKTIPAQYEIWGLSTENHKLNAHKMWISPKQNELRKIYSCCNVLLKLAVKEGYPLTILEAMKCGVIPIVSSEGGHLDYCKDHVNSLIVSSKKEVEEALKYISNSQDTSIVSLRESALETSTERTWEHFYRDLVDMGLVTE